jgi:thiamine biosynthesis protein ThiS
VRLIVNGKPTEVAGDVSIQKFLEGRGINTKFVAVARNGEIVKKSDYVSTILQEGDTLEVVRPVGGG